MAFFGFLRGFLSDGNMSYFKNKIFSFLLQRNGEESSLEAVLGAIEWTLSEKMAEGF